MKKLLFLLLFLILLLPGNALAATVFEDDFTDSSKVDTINTTATIDTADGCVRLPRAGTPNALAMNKFGDGYAVVTSTGIHMYEYDDSTGHVEENSAFSVPFINDAVGVAVRQDNVNIWAIRADGVQYCKFNGSVMADDPALKVSGIGQVLSVDAWEGTDKAVVMLNNGGSAQLKIYDATSGSLVNGLTQNLTITDPVAVSIIKGTADLRVATKDTLYYLTYDDATGNYVEDVGKKVTGLNNIISLSNDGSASSTTSNNNAQYIFDNDAGGGGTVAAYSIGLVTGAYAISLKPGSYDQALVTSSGDVQYWRYDDAQGKMVRDGSMEVTGMQLTGTYITPKIYYSKTFTMPDSSDMVRLTVTEGTPANTDTIYGVSSDGGLTFTIITPNTWTSVPSGLDFVVRTNLITMDTNVTPKIFYVKLETSTLVIKDLTVTAVARNKAGQVLPTSSFPVEVKAGADTVFEVTTEGFADSVWADLTTGASVILTNRQPITDDVNVWWGSYTVPVDAVDPSSIGITLTAQKDTRQKQLTVNPFINVRGKVTDVVDLAITQ